MQQLPVIKSLYTIRKGCTLIYNHLSEHLLFKDDYTTQLSSLIDDIFDELKLIVLEERIRIVDLIIETYLSDTDEKPKNAALSRLGHVLAWDYMEGDTRSYKATIEEYPIMTDSQYTKVTTGWNRERNAQGTTYRETELDPYRELNLDGTYESDDKRHYGY